MTVIFRIVGQPLSSSIHQFQPPCSRRFLFLSFEIHVPPNTFFPILYLRCHGIFTRFDAQTSGHTHEKDIARPTIRQSRPPHPYRSLCNSQSLRVRIQADMPPRPCHKPCRILAEALRNTVGKGSLKGPFVG